MNTALVTCLGDPVTPHKGAPLIVGTLSDMSCPQWWRDHGPALVVLYAWGMPRYTSIAKAIRDAGIRLQVQFDSDGVVSPRVDPWLYFYSIYWTYREHGYRNRLRAFPGILAGLNWAWHWINPFAYDRPMVRHLEQADWIALESPLAAIRVRQFLCDMARPSLADRVIVNPHPVADDFRYHGKAKGDEIIAVGRWQSAQKDPALLLRVLQEVLHRHPGWSATLIGSGDEFLKRTISVWPEPLRRRVRILGKIPHELLIPELQHARILLATSRYESFHIAAAEALCCGASVVGLAHLASFCHFVSVQSGSLAVTRRCADLVSAVSAEIHAWQTGMRDPEAISAYWRASVGVGACMNTIATRAVEDHARSL